jgi:general secretion pathway protein D
MLRGVNAAPVLPDSALQRSNNRGSGSTRMEGTQLIPPPADTRKFALPARS